MREISESDWESEGFFLRIIASIIYGSATSALMAALFFIYSSLNDVQHSGDAIALAIPVYWFLLPISIVAMLVTIKMSKPRWPKALAAFGLWSANVIASFAY